MKKIIALVLALTMAFSMALTVSAKESYTEETPDTFTGYTSNGVNVVITLDGVTVVHTYAFDIEYGTMEFTYGSKMTWDPATYTYIASNVPADWSAVGDSNKITVVNHSDLPIYCEAKGEVTEPKMGNFKLTVSEGKLIDGCEVVDEIGDNYHDMFVTLEGEPYVATANQLKIGAVSVTISKEAPATNDTTTEEPTEKPTEEPTENVQ